jgi:dTDP-4-amino-4,6-dideoxygalactose transaminase
MMERTATRRLTHEWAPWPQYSEVEIAAVTRVLRSGRVNQWTGTEIREFETEYAASLGRGHAIALMNGTVALELALRALGVGPGDEVVTTPRTFIASASVAVMRGAVPVMADVDRDSGNIGAAEIERVLTPRTKAIIVVHLGGWPADMTAIMDLARSRGVAVIEDCAQAHGAQHRGRPVGAYGDIAAFSFCQDKVMTTGGEGGLIALDHVETFKAAWGFKDHGKGYDTVYTKKHPPGFQWLHDTFGTNWRMTEPQAAIGRVQLARLEESVARRGHNASLWAEHLDDVPALRTPRPPAGDRHCYYRYYTYVRREALKPGWDRDRIREELRDAGLGVTAGSCGEIYREEAFVASGLAPAERLPVARELGETSLAFLTHPTLSEAAIHEAAELVVDVVGRATR